MRYSIGHIYRKPGLDCAAFRAHYESRHTRLAGSILPRFAHYVRNHPLDCTAPDAPDCISEFGLEHDEQWREIAAILGDERGQPLLADELLFMDKSRNTPYPIERRELAPAAPGFKYVITIEGTIEPGLDVSARFTGIGLQPATLCVAQSGECSWLFGWSDCDEPPAKLREQLVRRGVPVRWCALVEEVKGYPDND